MSAKIELELGEVTAIASVIHGIGPEAVASAIVRVSLGSDVPCDRIVGSFAKALDKIDAFMEEHLNKDNDIPSS